MNCPDGETLSAFADGALGPEECRRVERHIEECALCRHEAAEMAGAAAAFRKGLEALAISGTAAERAFGEIRRRRTRRALALAAAAAALLAAATGIWLARNQSAGMPAPVATGSGRQRTEPTVGRAEESRMPEWLQFTPRSQTYEEFVSLAPEWRDVEPGSGLTADADYGAALIEAARAIPLNGHS